MSIIDLFIFAISKSKRANLLSVIGKDTVLTKFPNTLFCYVYLMIASGCASSPSEYENFAAKPTPQIWKDGSTWQFHLVGREGNWLGSIDLMLNDEQVDTCTSGDWRKATVLRATAMDFDMSGAAFVASGGRAQVAYEINGATLLIDLHASICDSNVMLSGTLFETGAMGKVYYSTPFPAKGDDGDRGRFTAAPVIAQ